MSKFKGKVAVITGASSGIGKAIATALIAQEAKVCLVGRNLESLKVMPEYKSTDSSQIFMYQADFLIDKDVRDLANEIHSDHQQIDLLIHSAGIIYVGFLETSELEQFEQLFRVNVLAPFLITKLLLERIEICQGQIVFINSSIVFNSRPQIGQYSATKHALKEIADVLRMEVNKYGVRVLSIYPGRTATPMQKKLYALENKPYDPERLMQPEDVAEIVLSSLSLPLTSEVTDIRIRPLKN